MSRSRRSRWLPLVCGVATACAMTLPAVPQSSEGAGALRGVVYDRDFQVPLSGVRVSVAGTMLVTVTHADGAFLIENVPAGTYALAVTKDGYDREVVPNVTVTPGRLAELRVELAAEVVDMDEMVITGADLPITGEVVALEIREAAASMQDALSSDVMSKAGVGDVGGALKLVVGASVSEGRYATVRGLSDRYTGTTLNGVRIPSADPRRRAVPIDLFPTGTIESLTVTKTFTPDLQGDFTGGGLDIRTRSIPDRTVLSVSGSLEHNTVATGNDDYLTYVGGGVGSFGFAGGERDIPGAARAALPQFPRFTTTPPADQMAASLAFDSLVRSFDRTIGTTRGAAGPNSGFSLTGGTRFETGGRAVMGVLGSITQSRKRDFYDGGRNNNAGVSDPDQGITLTQERTDARGLDEVLLGGLLTFVVQPSEDHELSVRGVFNQSAEDEARLQVQDTGFPSTEQNQSLHYTERQMISAQAHGSHRLPGLRRLAIDWTGSVNSTSQEEPDVRFFRNVYDSSTLSARMPANSTDAQNTRRIFRSIDEENVQGMLNVTLPFTQWAGAPATFKAGAYLDATDRSYEQLSFSYTFPNQLGGFTNLPARENRALAAFQGTRPDQLWTDVFLDPDRVGLASNAPPAPNQLLWSIYPLGDDVNYTGDQEIDAVYAMAELPLFGSLKAVFGARYETTTMTVVPVNEALGTVEVIIVQPGGDRGILKVPQEDAVAEVDEGTLLPSIGLVYEPVPHMNVRATWSRTVARPTFRELAPVITEEFIFGDEFIGNPDLVLSDISNYDLRWEWFRRHGEVLAASVFYKDVKNPIELISFNAANRAFVQPINFAKGRVYGAEAEVRMPLDVLGEAVRDLWVGVNATAIHSELEVPAREQESLESYGLDAPTRRLQGQPDVLLNVNVGWDSERLGASAALFYNLVGETLRTGAARGSEDGVPDVYEEPFGTLDFTYVQKLQQGFSVSFKARNLLAATRRSVYRTPEGEEAVKSERETPVLYTLSGSWSW